MYQAPTIKRVASFDDLTLATGFQGGNDTLFAPEFQQDSVFSVDVCITPPNLGVEC
jgi:hypothetical protein